MSEVGIVTAGAEDVGELVCLNARLFREDAGSRDLRMDVSWPEKHGREHFLGLISGHDAVCLLSLSEGVAVGYLAGYMKEATVLRPVRVAELQSMYVRDEDRDRGVGTRLVEEFRAWAAGRGAERVSVSAHAANEGALRFYRRLGFAPRAVSLEAALPIDPGP